MAGNLACQVVLGAECRYKGQSNDDCQENWSHVQQECRGWLARPWRLAHELAQSFRWRRRIADLEQELTYAAVANDPKRALQLAHEGVAKGLTYQLVSLLRQVNQKDQDAGTQLAGDIIAKLETENFSNDFAPFFAVQLLQLSRTSGAVLVATTSENLSFTRLKLDDEQKQHREG